MGTLRSDDPPADGEAATALGPAGPEPAARLPLRLLAVLACFFLSGLAALIYQTAWTRQLSYVFGTSELAVATVLAAYMAGLASGAAAAGRLAPRIRHPLRVYGLLEGGIAVAALAVAPAMLGAQALFGLWLGGLDELPAEGGVASTAFFAVVAFVLLWIPTALMGATLPLLARDAVRTDRQVGARVAALYSANTVGAVAGTIAAGFWLLPELGLARTVWVGIAGNALVFGIALLLARGAPPPATVPDPSALSAPERGTGRAWILPAMTISGLVSFSYEVLWTRLLSHVLGGSVYAFATMLATFLAGIALGSALASRFAREPRTAVRAFGLVQCGIALCGVAAFLALDLVPDLARALARAGPGGVELRSLSGDAIVCAIVLLPQTLCIGATFPLAVRVLARDSADAPRASARVYAWNTLGSIAGALSAGFLWLPLLGFATTVAAAAVASLALAALAFVRGPGRARPRGRVAVGAALLCAAAMAILAPADPWRLLRSSPLAPEPTPGEVLWSAVGRSATVVAQRRGAAYLLSSNGLPESVVQPPGGRPGEYRLIQWLGALPALARPEARSMLVVGLGGGVVLESVPSSIERIDVIELEPEVVAANRYVSDLRRFDPLGDPRVRVTANDARGALLRVTRRWDAIVSQPSHPWSAGASHLYTAEFFELVRSHLEADGVFVQWMGLPFIDAALASSLIATLRSVFRHVVVYRPGAGLLFAASDEPIDLVASVAAARARAPDDTAELGVYGPADVLAPLLLDDAAAERFARSGDISSDDRNILQMRSPAIVRGGTGLGAHPDAAFAVADPLTRPDLPVDRALLVRRMLAQGSYTRALRVAEAAPERDVRGTAVGLVGMAAGQRARAVRNLDWAARRAADPLEARWALLRARRKLWVAGDETLVAWGDALGDPARAVLEGWRRAAREGRGLWAALADLDATLARVPAAHPAYPDAVALRVDWRLASGEPADAREALRLQDRMLAVASRPARVLRRAEIAFAAGYVDGAWTSLFEVAQSLGSLGDQRPLAYAVRDFVRDLPPGTTTADERQLIRERIDAVLR